MTQKTPDIRRVLSRLRALRVRVRTLFLVHGSSRLLVLAAGLVTATYVLDRLLVLPVSVRTLLFFGSVAWLVLELARNLVYPLRRVLSREDLAATVEKRFPELEDKLTSSIQFARALESDDFSESRALAGHTIRQTLDEVEALPFRRALTPAPVHRVAAVAVVAVALVAGYAAMNPEYGATWFRRMIALEDVRWPRQTFLEVLLPKQGRNLFVAKEGEEEVVTMARGEDLLVRIKANGKVPRSVSITYRTIPQDEERSRTETRLTSKVGTRDFQYSFLGVTESFEFFVRGGDDQRGEPVYRVVVLPPPRVESLTLACRYPPYTGRADETLDAGNVEFPVGTRIDFELTGNLDLESAFLVLDRDEGAPLEPAGPRVFRGSMTVEKNHVFSFRLAAENGLRNNRPMRFTIRAIPDLPPSLTVHGMGGADVDATVEAALPVRILSSDDYGVAGVSLLARIGREGAPTQIPLPPNAHIPAEGSIDDGNVAFPVAEKVLTAALIDMPALELAGAEDGLEAGDVLQYHVEAVDTHTDPEGVPLPQERETQPFRVHLVQRSELERKLNDWQTRLKSQIHKIVGTQESIRDELREIVELDPDTDELPSSDAQGVLDTEIEQNRITNETRRISRDFRQIFNTYLYNRLENSPLTEKLILQLMESARRFDAEEDERYRELFDAVPAVEREKSEILGKQLTKMELILAVAEELSPEVTRHLAAARKSPDATARRELLEGALARQDRILENLELLLQKMQEWEDFQEVLQEAKDLLELQRAIRARTLREIEAEHERGASDPRNR